MPPWVSPRPPTPVIGSIPWTSTNRWSRTGSEARTQPTSIPKTGEEAVCPPVHFAPNNTDPQIPKDPPSLPSSCPQRAPHLTVASRSSVLLRRWSKFSPRARIRSTFWVIIFLTPSTSLCRFRTRSFPAPPLASSWAATQGLIKPSGRGTEAQHQRPEEGKVSGGL